MTSDRLFSWKVLGLKYKVVLQLFRLCLHANIPSSTITIELGGRGYQRINAIDANKIEQMLKYRKASFPTFCRSLVGDYLSKLWGFPLYIQALASLFLQKRLNAWLKVIPD